MFIWFTLIITNERKKIGKISNVITRKIISKYTSTYGTHYYDLYFTNENIIGNYLGSKNDSLMAMPFGIYLTPYGGSKKSKKTKKVEIPEKKLRGETNNFFIKYEDIKKVMIVKPGLLSGGKINLDFKNEISGIGKKLVLEISKKTCEDIDEIKNLFLKELPNRTSIR